MARQTAFGDLLDRHLLERGLSVRDFARLVGVTASSVSTAKRKGISPSRLRAWALALQLSGMAWEEFWELGLLTTSPREMAEVLSRLHQTIAAFEEVPRSEHSRKAAAIREPYESIPTET